jgi:glycosyltransferase involved in cell wall biosynthesis
VLVSDIGANKQIGLNRSNYFRQGDVGALAEKIQNLLGSTLSEEERQDRFMMLKNKYDWDKIAEKTFNLYEEVLAIGES